MTESFLHYVWQFQYFNKNALATPEGAMIEVFNPGIHNTNAGPDFSNAQSIPSILTLALEKSGPALVATEY